MLSNWGGGGTSVVQYFYQLVSIYPPPPTNVSVAKPLLTAPPCPGSSFFVRLVPKLSEQHAR